MYGVFCPKTKINRKTLPSLMEMTLIYVNVFIILRRLEIMFRIELYTPNALWNRGVNGKQKKSSRNNIYVHWRVFLYLETCLFAIPIFCFGSNPPEDFESSQPFRLFSYRFVFTMQMCLRVLLHSNRATFFAPVVVDGRGRIFL